MLGSFHLFSVRDVPVRIHFTAFFLLPMIHTPGASLLFTLLFVLMILCSVGLHELGHTLVAQRYGIRVQDILLTPIGGVARLRGLPDDPHHEIRIALAGPYVSLFLALSGGLLTYLTVNTFLRPLANVFFLFCVLNTMLFLFNLLPSFPMDGGRVLRGWLSLRKGPLEATRIATSVGKFMSLAFIVIGLSLRMYTLAIIGVFILLAAGSEYRMMQVKAWRQGQLGEDLPGETSFEASPPPYEQSSGELKPPPGFVGDLLKTATDLVSEVRKTVIRE